MSLDLQEQLSSLELELERLEGLLARDENFRALEQLNARESQGNRVRAIDDQVLRANLEASLSSSRIYQARGRLLEVIALLKAELPREPDAPAPVATAREAIAEPVATVAETLDVDDAEAEQDVVGPEDRAPAAAQPVEAEPTIPSVAAVSVPATAAALIAADAAQGKSEAVKPEVAAPVEVPEAPDRLTLIKGINSDIADRLREAGIARFSQIAAWQRDDIERNSSALGLGGAIVHDGWIEQAALLAGGGLTKYARTYDRDEAAYLVAGPLSGQAVDEDFAAYLTARSLEHGEPAVGDADVSEATDATTESSVVANLALVPRPPTPLLGDRVFVPRRLDREETGSRGNEFADEAAMPPPLPISEALFEGLPGAEAGIAPADNATPMQFRLPDDGQAKADNQDSQRADGGEPLAGGAVAAESDEAEVTIVPRPADAANDVARAGRASANDNRREPATNRFVPPDPAAAGLGAKAAREVEAQVDIVRPEPTPLDAETIDAAALLTLSEEPQSPEAGVAHVTSHQDAASTETEHPQTPEPLVVPSPRSAAERPPTMAPGVVAAVPTPDAGEVEDEAVVTIEKTPGVEARIVAAAPEAHAAKHPVVTEPSPAANEAIAPAATLPEARPLAASTAEEQSKVAEASAGSVGAGAQSAAKKDGKSSRLLRALTGE